MFSFPFIEKMAKFPNQIFLLVILVILFQKDFSMGDNLMLSTNTTNFMEISNDSSFRSNYTDEIDDINATHVTDELLPISIKTTNAFDHLIVLEGAPNQALSCEASEHYVTKIIPRIRWKWIFNGQLLNNNPASQDVVQIDKNQTSYLIFPKIYKRHSGNYTCIADNVKGRDEMTQRIDVTDNQDLAPICIPGVPMDEKDANKNAVEELIEESQNDTNLSKSDSTITPHRTKRYISYYWGRPKPASTTLFNKDMQEMINLIAQRLLLADKVAIAKWDQNQPIEDPPREELILQKVVSQAQSLGIDINWARTFFRDQMEANKDIQNGLFDQWRKHGHRPWGPSVDLAKDVRPLIDEINNDLMTYSKKTETVRKLRMCRMEVEQDARYTTFLYSLDHLHQRALQRATYHICNA